MSGVSAAKMASIWLGMSLARTAAEMESSFCE